MKIEIQNLCCGYHKAPLTEPINMHIEQGETLCILGANGAGKTTFLKTLQGFLPPVSGCIYIDGINCHERVDRRALARIMAYVPQIHGQPFSFTALDMVLMGRAPHINSFSMPKNTDIQKCREIMDALGILSLEGRSYARLSGGEQQLVLIARAVAQEPAFLLMDEPTSNLDYGNKLHVLRHCLQLSESGMGVIMITHSPEQAFACADKVLLFGRDGTVLCGDCESILTEPRLSAAYQIGVKLFRNLDSDGQIITTCSPVLK